MNRWYIRIITLEFVASVQFKSLNLYFKSTHDIAWCADLLISSLTFILSNCLLYKYNPFRFKLKLTFHRVWCLKPNYPHRTWDAVLESENDPQDTKNWRRPDAMLVLKKRVVFRPLRPWIRLSSKRKGVTFLSRQGALISLNIYYFGAIVETSCFPPPHPHPTLVCSGRLLRRL